MTALFANDASSKLNGTLGTGGTSATITTGDGTLFPNPNAGAGEYFMVVLEDRSQTPVVREICKCTAISGDTMTLVRAQESTTALSWASGITVANRLTAGTAASLRDDAVLQQRFFGSLASAPSMRNDGRALIAGDMYFDTVFQMLFTYNGVAWVSTLLDPVGDLDLTGNLSVSQTASVGGNMTVGGATTIQGATSVVGALGTASTFSAAGAASLGSTLRVAGATTLIGAVNIGGATTVVGNASIGGSGSIGANLAVVGTISGAAIVIGESQVATLADVSGDTTQQDFPNGTTLKWGSAVSDSTGTAVVTFDTPFPNEILRTFPSNVVSNYTAGLSITFQIYARSAAGFTVKTLDSATRAPLGNVTLEYLAIGG